MKIERYEVHLKPGIKSEVFPKVKLDYYNTEYIIRYSKEHEGKEVTVTLKTIGGSIMKTNFKLDGNGQLITYLQVPQELEEKMEETNYDFIEFSAESEFSLDFSIRNPEVEN